MVNDEGKEKKFLKLEEILYSNATNDVYIPAIDRYVKIKNASIRDRREAEKLAVLHPAWNSMSSNDKEAEVVRMLALQIMVEPRITYEDYINAEDTITQIILNAVANEYYLRLNELMKEKSGKDIGDFLRELTKNTQKDSLDFSKQETLTGNHHQESMTT